MNSSGEFVEVQGTGEKGAFSRQNLDTMLNLAYKGIGQIIDLQNQILEDHHIS